MEAAMSIKNRRPRVAHWSATGVAFLTILAFGTLAPANASGSRSGPVMSATSDPITSDIAVVAAQLSISPDEAVALGDAQAAFAALAESIATDLADGYIAAEWTPDGGTITVQAGVEAAARQSVSEAGSEASVIISAAPNSIEQERAQLALVDAIYDAMQVPFSSSWSIAPSEATLRVEITADRATLENSGADLDGAEARAEDIAAALGGTAAFTYGAGADELAARGGMPYGSNYCTGGFIVESTAVSGRWGILTARHCDSAPGSYDGSTVGLQDWLTNRDLRVARLSGGGGVTSQFQATAGGFRTVSTFGMPTVGQNICKWGGTTGYSCDTIAASGHCSTFYMGVTFCGLYKTSNNNVIPGDSGGPWFFNYHAYGITSGFNASLGYDMLSGVGTANTSPINYEVRN